VALGLFWDFPKELSLRPFYLLGDSAFDFLRESLLLIFEFELDTLRFIEELLIVIDFSYFFPVFDSLIGLAFLL